MLAISFSTSDLSGYVLINFMIALNKIDKQAQFVVYGVRLHAVNIKRVESRYG